MTTTVDAPGSFWHGAEVIHTYSRADALRDGALVDVTDTAREAGFSIPVAMTRAAWVDLVQWGEDDDKRKPEYTGQDEAGRLWDVLFMASMYARRNRGTDRFLGQLVRIPREGRGLRPRKALFRVHIGPGDTAAPVLTITLPNED